MIRQVRAATMFVLLAAVVAGCSTEKDAPLETRKQADVETQARQQADALAGLMGGTVTEWESSTKACMGRNGEIADDGRWSLTGFGVVKLPVEQHLSALQAVDADGRAKGWEITDFRTLSDARTGVLSGRDPQSGFSVSLASSNPPIQIAVTLGSPCFRPAEGEDPANA